jgi:hypothetical protein
VKHIDQEPSKRSRVTSSNNTNDREKVTQSRPTSTLRIQQSNQLTSSINNPEESTQDQTSKLSFF